MFAVAFFIEVLYGYLLSVLVPESLALLVSSVGLIGATVVLRRFLKRRDGKTGEEKG